jgi:hypothetical protein
MYNCWNEAVEYLIKKYGETTTPINQYEPRKPQSARTFKRSPESDKDVIVLLLNQYHYGMLPKKELYYMMIDLGQITE